MNPDIEHRFTYHAPKADQAERYQMIRDRAKELAYLLTDLCPPGRELSLALTNLEQVVFWGNASIARGE
jgi:hypothetical protein